MKKIFSFLTYTQWQPIRYIWPYEPGYGIYRKNRWTGKRTVIDRYDTIAQAFEAAKIQNSQPCK